MLIDGFGDALTPTNLLLALIGVTIGTAVGVLPGIGPALTVALLLPITFKLEPTGALILFAGVYYGGMYGGSTTAILLNTPGRVPRWSPPSRATRWRAPAGRARAGHGRDRLVRRRHHRDRPADLRGPAVRRHRREVHARRLRRADGDRVRHRRHPARRLAAQGRGQLLIGLTIGLVGIESQSGQARLTFGIPTLLDGVDVVIVVVALFAIGEVFAHALSGGGGGTVRRCTARP